MLYKLIAILFVSSILSCSDENITNSIKEYERGEIIEVESIRTYSLTEITVALSFSGITDNLDLQYAVQALRIVYQTVDSDGDLITASGALMIPVSSNIFPLLSIQHGTETRRGSVASENPINSIEGVSGLITGSKGYVTCIPDYPGFGVSDKIHPYVHAKSLALSVIDFLIAANDYCSSNNINLNQQIFLGGYSEGGYATLATQKEIEQNYPEFNLTAVVPMAGPYDLLGTADIILNQADYSQPAYIGYLFTAYNDIYKWNRLENIFNEPYAGMMEQLFDGSNSFSEINNSLPTNISELLNANFISGILNRTETEVIAALEENTLLNWVPIAPIRFYHGDADQTVPYQNTLTARDSLLENGAAQIELVTIPGGTHSSAGLPSVLGMIDWFNQFLLVL